jgi:hypothetical protein
VPALTFCVSASFCLAKPFASSSLRNVSVAREKARFPVGNLMAGASTLVLRTAEDGQASSISSQVGASHPSGWGKAGPTAANVLWRRCHNPLDSDLAPRRLFERGAHACKVPPIIRIGS